VTFSVKTADRLGKPTLALLWCLGVEAARAAGLGIVSQSAVVRLALQELNVGLFCTNSSASSSSNRKLQTHRRTGHTPHMRESGQPQHKKTSAVGRPELSWNPWPIRLARSPKAFRYMTQLPRHNPTLSSQSADSTKADLLTAPQPAVV
jgi:hypothetical protein